MKSVADTTKTLLESVKPLPTWAEARLNYEYKAVYFANKKGDAQAAAKHKQSIEAIWSRVEEAKRKARAQVTERKRRSGS